MRKLLIVDDEKNIRLGLRAIIEREQPGTYEILLASDSEEALELCEQTHIDIVITDIRMPGMDGITLIQRLMEYSHRPAVVILSGYDDFQFAKEAIKYGVQEYLLKPVIREELIQALIKIEQNLTSNEDISSKLNAADQYIEELRASQLHFIFINPQIKESEIAEICSRIGLVQDGREYVVGVLRLMDYEQSLVHRDEFFSKVAALLEEQVTHFFDKDENLVIVAPRESYFTDLSERISKLRLANYCIGQSEGTKDVTEIKVQYSQAVKALKYRFLHQESELITYGSMKGKPTDFTIPLEEINKISNMIGTDREKEMKALLQEIFDIRKINKYDISYIEGINKHLNELVFDKVFNVYGEESVEILRIYKKVGDLYHFDNFHEFFHNVDQLLFRLNAYIKNIKSVHIDHAEIKKAIRYINDNYHKDLNMATVSNYVSLNYSYFSQAFKEYTGESFVNYLRKMRIDKAKELLERTDLKVYEISDRVGFENAKNFNRVFRVMEGISPIEYRTKKTMRL